MENIEMKKNNKYLIGMLMLLPICLLMYTFAYTNEEIRIFYCILEYLGLYDSNKYSTRNTILWVVVIVLLVILLKISFRLTKLKKYRMMEYRFLRTLPYLILCLNIISCFLFPRIERIFLQYQHGLDSIIVPNRGTASLLAYTGRDAAGYNTGPLLALNLESFGSESEDFFVKFIDIEDESKQYVHCNENGIPQKHSMGGLSYITSSNKGNYRARHTSLLFDLEKTIPGYIDTIENRSLIKYKVVIYNDKESKTFYFYFPN